MIIARGFAVDLFHKSLRYFTRFVRYFIIFPRRGARFERLRLTHAANQLPMNVKSRDRPMRTQQAPGIMLGAVAQG